MTYGSSPAAKIRLNKQILNCEKKNTQNIYRSTCAYYRHGEDWCYSLFSPVEGDQITGRFTLRLNETLTSLQSEVLMRQNCHYHAHTHTHSTHPHTQLLNERQVVQTNKKSSQVVIGNGA